ncbi:MAG: GTPase domain-containing protein [Burkholderiaceae bacterium]
MKDDPQTISLSLVSHTNVGKTTLARTLLNRTIGDVRDEAHVTDQADAFTLLETTEGDRLVIWDTPGFGDTARLARRLENSDRAFGWLLSQVWDRLADRALYSSQQAVRNVRDEADVVLYLVNAAEDPGDSGYVEPEMKILHWIGKPIIVLVNQMGPPRGPKDEAAEVDRWRDHLSDAPMVQRVIALDAFARCWVQEGVLLKEVAKVLPEDKGRAFGRLHRAWQTQRRATFDAAMAVLADQLVRAALDHERIASDGLRGRLREVGQALGVAREREDSARQQAMRALAQRLDDDIRNTTNELIRLHGLEGEAGMTVLKRLADHYATSTHLSEGRAAVFGGLLTGALAGLKADVVTGGLTLGGGMIAGGVLGALGAAGLARGYNMVRGIDAVTVSWTDEIMNRLLAGALLTYLAVAHYGRGRGEWAQSEHPAFWETVVTEVLAQQGTRFQDFWRRRQAGTDADLRAAVQHELTLAAERVLIRLYPEAVDAAAIGTSTARISAEARADAAKARAADPGAADPGAADPGAAGSGAAAAGAAGAEPAGGVGSDPDTGLRHHPA